MQKIRTSLWFDDEAEEAANFYIWVFEGRPGASPGSSKTLEVLRYGEAGPRKAGTVMTVAFQLEGQEFMALNGGPDHTFTEAVSLFVNCESQEEVDELWSKLSEGGEEGPCGWLKDRFGLSWQIVPTVLTELQADPDPAKAQAVMRAMLQMGKIDIQGLRRAYEAAKRRMDEPYVVKPRGGEEERSGSRERLHDLPDAPNRTVLEDDVRR